MNKNIHNTQDWSMTVEELRRFKQFENISEEEGEKVIDSLVQLAIIAYESNPNMIEE